MSTKGITTAAAACLFTLLQGCALQPTHDQSSPGEMSSDTSTNDSASTDIAAANKQSSDRSGWARAHHQGNPYFRTTTSTSEGSVTVEGNAIHYHAVAGLLIVHPKGWNDAADKHGDDDSPKGPHSGHHERKQSSEASMFYVAYFRDGEKPGDRPITFLYNGGPGSSTVWLHMGALGPRRVVTADHVHSPPAPYQLVSNDYSLLDASDLVFIDAPGTGFSRVKPGAEKDFYGADPDAHAFSEFIMQFLSKYGRWNSPKYLFGESYGTPRSANLINVLETEDDTDFNGVILLSQILNLDNSVDVVPDNPGIDVAYELALPTYAATAWYHHKLRGNSEPLSQLVSEVEQFSMGDYAAALRAGSELSPDQRDAIAAKLHDYTGLPVSYIQKANLRIDGGEFEHSLQSDTDTTTGRLDSRFSGPSIDPLSQRADYDPQSAAIGSAYVSAFNAYIRSDPPLRNGNAVQTGSRRRGLELPASTARLHFTAGAGSQCHAGPRQRDEVRPRPQGNGERRLLRPGDALLRGHVRNVATADAAEAAGEHRVSLLRVRAHGLCPRSGAEGAPRQRRSVHREYGAPADQSAAGRSAVVSNCVRSRAASRHPPRAS